MIDVPGNNVRFFDKISNKTVTVPLSDERKNEIIKKAGNFFPYPVIVAHDGHYTILHLDRDFNDRGTVQTQYFIDLDEDNLDKIDPNSNSVLSEKRIYSLKEEMMCELKEDILDDILIAVRSDLQDHIKKEIKKELKTSLKVKKTPTKKSTRKKSTAKKSKKSTKKTKKTTKKKTSKAAKKNTTKSSTSKLDALSGFGLDGL